MASVMSLRLHVDGGHILCGVTDCGARLGRVDTHQGGPGLLVLMPGYRRDRDGVFRLTKHAAKRRQRGELPRRRGRATFPEHHEPLASVLSALTPCCPPWRVKCPTCGQVQDATAEGLGIGNRTHAARQTISTAGGGMEVRQYGPDEHQDHPVAWLPQFMPRKNDAP